MASRSELGVYGVSLTFLALPQNVPDADSRALTGTIAMPQKMVLNLSSSKLLVRCESPTVQTRLTLPKR